MNVFCNFYQFRMIFNIHKGIYRRNKNLIYRIPLGMEVKIIFKLCLICSKHTTLDRFINVYAMWR
jgi:hypothetical protein